MGCVTESVRVSLDEPDPAGTQGVDVAVGRLLPALEQFLASTEGDRAVKDRANWVAALDRGLPYEGAGLDTVVDELARWVIPLWPADPGPGLLGLLHRPRHDRCPGRRDRRPGRWARPLFPDLL